jgi:hypothetical protein
MFVFMCISSLYRAREDRGVRGPVRMIALLSPR